MFGAYANDHVYPSDGLVNKRITGGTCDWGIPVPGPVMHGVAGPGRSRSGSTWPYIDGRARVRACATVAIGANSAIVSGLPVSANADVVAVRIYLSPGQWNPAFPRGHGGHGQTSPRSRPIPSAPASPSPPSSCPHAARPHPEGIQGPHAGGLRTGGGSASPMPMTWCIAGGFLQFPADVTVVEPVDGGVFVVADKTYFMAGSGPADWAQRLPVLGLRCRVRHGCQGPQQPNLAIRAWPVIRACRTGKPRTPTEAHAAQDSGTTGAGLYRERDGLRQFIASIRPFHVTPGRPGLDGHGRS